jgi:uncharacterized protein (UPF0333 family)
MKQKTLLILGCILLLAAVTVYAYFFTAESQSSAVVRVDPEKAQKIRQLRESAENGIPEPMRPPGQE